MKRTAYSFLCLTSVIGSLIGVMHLFFYVFTELALDAESFMKSFQVNDVMYALLCIFLLITSIVGIMAMNNDKYLPSAKIAGVILFLVSAIYLASVIIFHIEMSESSMSQIFFTPLLFVLLVPDPEPTQVRKTPY